MSGYLTINDCLPVTPRKYIQYIHSIKNIKQTKQYMSWVVPAMSPSLRAVTKWQITSTTFVLYLSIIYALIGNFWSMNLSKCPFLSIVYRLLKLVFVCSIYRESVSLCHRFFNMGKIGHRSEEMSLIIGYMSSNQSVPSRQILLYM